MGKIIISVLTIMIFLSCTERSPEIISEGGMPTIQVTEDITPPIQIIECNTESENIQNQPLAVSNNRNQHEFNAYEASQRISHFVQRNNFQFMATLGDFGVSVLELFTFVAFSRDDLYILRNRIENDLLYNPWIQQALSAGRVSEEYLNATYGHNINLIKAIEANFPVANEVNSSLIGVWRLARSSGNQGYIIGDYLILYENGLFEYISRNFMATRFSNQILGGSRFGLWTTNTDADQESDIELLIISEFNAATDDPFVRFEHYETVISAFGNSWRKFSNNVNIELEWGSW